MKTKRLPRIGLSVDRVAEHGYRILLGIVRYWQGQGGCDFRSVDANPEEWPGLLKTHRCLGAIVEANSPERMEAARGLSLPVVNVSSRFDLTGVVNATTDDHAIGVMAAEYLLQRGFRRFGYVGMPTRFSRVRLDGFLGRLAQAGLGCTCVPDAIADDLEHGLPAWVARLEKPVAFFACNDRRGLRMVQFCSRAGIRIPEELAIVGCDDDPIECEISEVPLSSVDPGFENVGYQAARTLHRLLAGHRPPGGNVLVPPQRVVVRRSSNFLAVDDPGVAKALRYISEHATEPITIDDVAAGVSLSRRNLERRYRAALNRAPGDDLRQARLSLAKQTLMETSLPMPMIAERSGFSDAKVFGMTFRRQTGLTPSQFRAQFRTY